MEVRSITRTAKISAFKAREVTREIQGLSAAEALDVLRYSPKKAARMLTKTLKSAIANAVNNHEMREAELRVREAAADEGPTIHRFKSRARGSADPIRKRTAHLKVVVTDEPAAEKKKPQKRERPARKTREGAAAENKED